MSLAQDIKQKALELGFDLVGITGAWPIDAEQIELLTNWLKSGFAGQMSYMQQNFEKRIKPAKLLENAKSVISVGLNYKPPKQKQTPTNRTAPAGKVASYAQYEDYHLFIKKQLRKLIDSISSINGPSYKFKICVDSAPLAERALAARAGLGFIAKNHILINPKLGPQIFLGEIITNLELKPLNGCGCDTRFVKRQTLNATDTSRVTVRRNTQPAALCESCSNCIAACPTGALRSDGQFDANKCVSYLTIEHKGQIPTDLADKIGDRLFGCDECVLACPYHENAPVCKNQQFKFYDDRSELNLREVLNLTEEQFETRFADSVIKRLGLARLQRNAQICLANI